MKPNDEIVKLHNEYEKRKADKKMPIRELIKKYMTNEKTTSAQVETSFEYKKDKTLFM